MKKVIGILLIVIGGLIFVVQFASLLYNLTKLVTNFKAALSGDAYGLGFVIGMLVVKIIILLIGFFMIAGGASMVRSGRRKPHAEES